MKNSKGCKSDFPTPLNKAEKFQNPSPNFNPDSNETGIPIGFAKSKGFSRIPSIHKKPIKLRASFQKN